MEKYKYVGKTPSPNRLMANGAVPVPVEIQHETNISNFVKVFRDQVITTMLTKGSWTGPSLYADLAPQHGAFDRLLEVIKYHGYELVSVTRNSVERGEFLCRVQIRIPVQPRNHDILFQGGVPQGHKGYVLVSFDTGVCREFTRLMKKNEIVDAALEILQKFSACDLAKVEVPADEIARASNREEIDGFDPEIAIMDTLNYMRAELRYSILHGVENYASSRFYQTPEGYIYRVEVDGYVTLAM